MNIYGVIAFAMFICIIILMTVFLILIYKNKGPKVKQLNMKDFYTAKEWKVAKFIKDKFKRG